MALVSRRREERPIRLNPSFANVLYQLWNCSFIGENFSVVFQGRKTVMEVPTVFKLRRE